MVYDVEKKLKKFYLLKMKKIEQLKRNPETFVTQKDLNQYVSGLYGEDLPNKGLQPTQLNTIWGEEVIVGDRTIDVHIRKLREKIGDDYIKTIKGVGYKFGR